MGRRGRTARRMPRCLEAELPRRAEIEQPGGEDAVLDDGTPHIGDAFAVEGLRAQAAPAMRVVDDGHARREDLRAQLVLEEAGAARDRRAADGADEMAQNARGDSGIEDDGRLTGWHLARAEALHRALTSAPPDLRGIAQVPRINRAAIIVIAL